ncbi:CLUMA_CG021214, isoform A [Clunio marinus]|uniref:CLUMA_CG021214, isoform A n=1 Tax=Clunio marinus TaxID=568069 RepID=A0A1J1J6E6_9DIPT|nr:CLUMA_CG021214, isoform A [Clunio marinus]
MENDQRVVRFCIIKYLSDKNITLNLNSDSDNEISCIHQHKDIDRLLQNAYENVEKNLYNSIRNATEADCLINVFRTQKFFEKSILMTTVYLTPELVEEDKLREVFDISRNIFTFAMTKCLLTDEIVMNIFEDLSVKIQVDVDELNCINKALDSQSSTISTNNSSVNDVNNEDQTTVKFDDYDEITTIKNDGELSSSEIEIQNGKTSANNFIRKNPTLNIKVVEDSKKTEDCNIHLLNLYLRTSSYKYPSLTNEENQCMKASFTENDLITIFKLISLKHSVVDSTTNSGEYQKKLLNELIVKTLWNLMECVDIFGFFDVISMLTGNEIQEQT